MPQYSWTIKATKDGETAAVVSESLLADFDIHDVVSAIKGETIEDGRVLQLFAVRTDRDGQLFAPVTNGDLPIYFPSGTSNGPFVHEDLRKELWGFKMLYDNLLAATPEQPPIAIEPPVAT
jgi:hypothetical protein